MNLETRLERHREFSIRGLCRHPPPPHLMGVIAWPQGISFQPAWHWYQPLHPCFLPAQHDFYTELLPRKGSPGKPPPLRSGCPSVSKCGNGVGSRGGRGKGSLNHAQMCPFWASPAFLKRLSKGGWRIRIQRMPLFSRGSKSQLGRNRTSCPQELAMEGDHQRGLWGTRV